MNRKHPFYTTISVLALLFICGSCFKDEGIFADNGPATRLLGGSWNLERKTTPTGTLIGAKIGYSERMVVAPDSGYMSEKTFRNDTLVSRQYWGPYSSHIIDKKKYTYIMNYRYGLKRFYKIYLVVGEGDLMEATGYVSAIGAPEDTVRYYYKGENP